MAAILQDSTVDQIQSILSNLMPRQPVFLTGAGISKESGLPLAWEMKNRLLGLLCRGSDVLIKFYQRRRLEWESKCSPVMLEALFGVIERYDINFVERFTPAFLDGRPNQTHFALSSLLANDYVQTIVTLNFDVLIEEAYRQITARVGPEHASSLQVIIEEKDYLLWDRTRPTLLKLHGCASNPPSIVVTLSRVGLGLETWKYRALEELAAHPFVFLGYSDNDKDITPALYQFGNDWIWLFYSGPEWPKERHVPAGLPLEKMLCRRKSENFYTESSEAIRRFAKSLDSSLIDVATAQSTSATGTWSAILDSAVLSIPMRPRALILADILREHLTETADAEFVLSYCLRDRDLTDLERIDVLLKRNVVYGETWKNPLVGQNLDRATLLALNHASTKLLPKQLLGKIFKQMGDYYQQTSQDYGKRALDVYDRAETCFNEADDQINAVWSRVNKAITLHKMARHNEAEEIFHDAIELLRKKGERVRLGQTLLAFGSLLSATHRYKEAEEIYINAKDEFSMLGLLHYVARFDYNIADLYVQTKRESAAVPHLKSARDILEVVEDEHWLENVERLLESLRKKGFV